MATSKELFEQAEKLRDHAVSKDDQVLKYVASALAVCIVGTFAGVLTFMGWYADTSMTKAASESLQVQIPYTALGVFMALVVGWGAVIVLGVYLARKQHKEARAVREEATALEKEELELVLKQQANERAAAAAEHQRAAAERELISRSEGERQAQELARDAAARAERAAEVAKAAQKSQHTRLETKDGRNKPGGTSGRDTGR